MRCEWTLRTLGGSPNGCAAERWLVGGRDRRKRSVIAGASCPGPSLLTIGHHSGTSSPFTLLPHHPVRVPPFLHRPRSPRGSPPSSSPFHRSLLSTVQVTGHSFKSNQLPNHASLCTGCFRIQGHHLELQEFLLI